MHQEIRRSSGSCCMRRTDCDDHKNPNRNLQIQLNTDGPINPSSTTDFMRQISVLDASLPDSTWTFESQQVQQRIRASVSAANTLSSHPDQKRTTPCWLPPHALGSLSSEVSAQAGHLGWADGRDAKDWAINA
ncbi:protocadherin gamma-C5-like protein [Lates japonicus]|uniref:Protocadherin gamma-C5-like protein n=1 Tax=Lates japonicus TaxID=270547 RepID=A0AAD3N7I8_LATJO|nr:protocadherin gamma-C5-like protein [Lates japonicus]